MTKKKLVALGVNSTATVDEINSLVGIEVNGKTYNYKDAYARQELEKKEDGITYGLSEEDEIETINGMGVVDTVARQQLDNIANEDLTIGTDGKLYIKQKDGSTKGTGVKLPSTSGATGADGKSAYQIAVANGFVGTETAWLASLKGATGATGEKGEKGDTGATPNLQIGTVETLESGSSATASITGTKENPLLNLGIPSGLSSIINSIKLEIVKNDILCMKYNGGIIQEINLNKILTFGEILDNSSNWIVMGDSITDETISPTTKYVTLLSNKHQVTKTNYGKNGAHVTNYTNTSSPTLQTVFGTMPDGNYDLFTIMAGVNDYTHYSPLGDYDGLDDTTFYGGLNVLMSAIREKYPTALKIWILPIPKANETTPSSAGLTLQEYRDAIKLKCVEYGFLVIDVSQEEELDASIICSDGLHPTADGHKVLADILDKAIIMNPNGNYVGIYKPSTGGGSTGDEDLSCTNITLDKSSLTFTSTDTQTLLATVTPSNTTDSIVWSVNDSTIVSVANGVVTPKVNGSCIITATCGTQSATCSVTVNINIPSPSELTPRLITFSGSSSYNFTGLVDNGSSNPISKVTIRVKAHDFTGGVYIKVADVHNQVFYAQEAILGNGTGTMISWGYPSEVIDGANNNGWYEYTWTGKTTTPSYNYLKVPLRVMTSPSTTKQVSMYVDKIEILVDDVRKPIMLLGDYTGTPIIGGEIEELISQSNSDII